mgnify:CR=1 FL=1
MPNAQKLQLKLWHLFVGFALVSIGLWLTTQYGISKGEIEIIEFEDWNGFEISAERPALEISKIQFRFLVPDSLKHRAQVSHPGKKSPLDAERKSCMRLSRTDLAH